jgi:dihydrofolate reductase
MERKLKLFIAMSLDGYIADHQGDLGFLSIVEQPGEDYGYAEFTQSVDAIILGRKTYEKVLSMGFEYPHTDKAVYIITRTERPAIGSFEFYTGDLATLVSELKSKPGKHIYCDGGAEIAHELARLQLIDEYIISVIPVLLGAGVRLFKDDRPEQKLRLLSSKAFEKGLLQVHYEVK